MADNVDVSKIFTRIRDQWEEFFAKEGNSDMYFNLIKELVHQQLNFDVSMYREHYLKGRIYQRIRTKKFETFQHYLEVLHTDTTEIHHLKGLLTIHTTNFFRDVTPFRYLEKVLLPKICKNISNPFTPIKILSAPCSTGQEVYSIAIIVNFLKSTNVIHNPVEIYGIDIDEESINTARRGIYKKKIIRNISQDSLNRNFDYLYNDIYQVKENIRQYCQFSVHDIFKPLHFEEKFDFIACRNLLIYISKEEQKLVIDNLKQNARKDTFFMLGNTEGISLFYEEEFRTESSNEHIFQYLKGIPEEEEIELPIPLKQATEDHQKSPETFETTGDEIKVDTSFEIKKSFQIDKFQEHTGIIKNAQMIRFDSNLKLNIAQDRQEHNETVMILQAIEKAEAQELSNIIEKAKKLQEDSIKRLGRQKRSEEIQEHKAILRILDGKEDEKSQEMAETIKRARSMQATQIPQDMQATQIPQDMQDDEDIPDTHEMLNNPNIQDSQERQMIRNILDALDARKIPVSQKGQDKPKIRVDLIKVIQNQDSSKHKINLIKTIHESRASIDILKSKADEEAKRLSEIIQKAKAIQHESINKAAKIKEIKDQMVTIDILHRKEEDEARELAKIIEEAKKLQEIKQKSKSEAEKSTIKKTKISTKKKKSKKSTKKSKKSTKKKKSKKSTKKKKSKKSKNRR